MASTASWLRCVLPLGSRIPRVLRGAVFAGLGAGLAGASLPPEPFALPSLEELASAPVVTVSQRAEPAWNAAAALSLVTADDIRRSGARSLTAALRLAPGLSVAQIDSRDWMVGARGFDQQFANKLLVMIDGRSIYSPWFGGVFWDEHDVLLEDLEQIEVVRGPGAAVWGANAVNGVINIVTKPATRTTGLLVTSTAGTTETSGSVRYGARLGRDWAWRVYARAFRHGSSRLPTGGGSEDDWHGGRAGFRLDRDGGAGGELTFEAEAYRSRGDFPRTGVRFTPPDYGFSDRDSGVRLSGGHVRARWSTLGNDGEGVELRASADTSWRLQSAFEVKQEAAEVAFQQVGARGRHLWSWGGGVRATRDRSEKRYGIGFEPADDSSSLTSLFLQDQIDLVPDRLQLIAGARFEDSDYVDREVQPNLRLIWRPTRRVSWWAAVSRAVRSPTRTETALRFDASVLLPPASLPDAPATVIRWEGRPDFQRETLIAYEGGFRLQPTPKTRLDVSTYVHAYDDLSDIAPDGTPIASTSSGVDYVLSPWTYQNLLEGKSYGAEVAFTYQPAPHLRWQAGGTWTRVSLSGPSGGINEAYFEGSTPKYEAFVRGVIAFSPAWEASVGARAVGARPSLGIKAYQTVDARVGWKIRPDLELELLAENLADPVHPEFREALGNLTYHVRRSVFVRVTWRP